MLRLLGAFRCPQPILGGLRLRRNTRCYPLPASMRDRSAPQNGLSAAKQRATRIDGRRREWRILSMPYAPPIGPIFGSGIAIMPPARIPGRLTSSRLVGSTRSVIFCRRDPHLPAVWLVCHIPLDKLPGCLDHLSMHSCEQDRIAGAGLTANASQDGSVAGLLRFGRGENQNQGREPTDRDEAQPQNGFCCSRTGRARRGLVRASCFFVFVSFLGSSATLLFATAGAGSAAARIGNASDGGGGTHGESA